MDERLVKTSNKHHDERKADTRESADASLASANERRKMFREFQQEALPTPPARPGWHHCWLSMTNQYDPIYKRVRMGYQPVKADDIKDFEHYRIKSGEYEGCISVNEMVLFEIPQEVYQEMMLEYHHYRPLEEEARIKANALSGEKDSNGKMLGSIEGEGISELAARVKTPTFN
jgi:hypothetical protein